MMMEPSLHDQLLADYDRLEDRVEDAATVELWALADWLAEYVPPRDPGPQGDKCLGTPISLEDLSARRGRSVNWLQRLRRVAITTAPDRLPKIGPRVYIEALRANGGDLMAANQSIVTKGHRLRDQPGPVESVDALKSQLGKRTPEERAAIARELADDPTVAEIMAGEPTPDFGVTWADKFVIRLDEQADKLTMLVASEGLVFSPDANLRGFMSMLERTEERIADVRAAVQERLRDARMEEVN